MKLLSNNYLDYKLVQKHALESGIDVVSDKGEN